MFNKEEKPKGVPELPASPEVKNFADEVFLVKDFPSPNAKPKEFETEKLVVADSKRRVIDCKNQKEVKEKFSQMIEKDPDTGITCVVCDINTYYSLCSKFQKFKSDIRWKNGRVDYK